MIIVTGVGQAALEYPHFELDGPQTGKEGAQRITGLGHAGTDEQEHEGQPQEQGQEQQE